MSILKKLFGGGSDLERAVKNGSPAEVQRLLKQCNDLRIIQKTIVLANRWKWHSVSKNLRAAFDNLAAKGQLLEEQKKAQLSPSTQSGVPTAAPKNMMPIYEVEKKKLGPCPRCSGRGTITVDSGTTLSGPAEREFRNRTIPCPDCVYGFILRANKFGPDG